MKFLFSFLKQGRNRAGSLLRKGQSGFTLVETLVAISILMIAITGPLVIASQVLNYSYFARDQVTAFYLAQDAIEYIHNIRDTNAIYNLKNPTAPRSWLTNLENCLSSAGDAKCRFDSKKDPAEFSNIVTCSTGVCPAFKYNSNTGLYGYDSGADSRFSREISMQEIVRDVEASITVTIFWNTGPLSGRSVSVTEHIFNWH